MAWKKPRGASPRGTLARNKPRATLPCGRNAGFSTPAFLRLLAGLVLGTLLVLAVFEYFEINPGLQGLALLIVILLSGLLATGNVRWKPPWKWPWKGP